MKGIEASLFTGLGGLALLVSPTIVLAQVEWPFGQPIRVVSAEGPDREARQAQVAVDPKGRIYITFGVGDTVRCARSGDGGRRSSLPRSARRLPRRWA